MFNKSPVEIKTQTQNKTRNLRRIKKRFDPLVRLRYLIWRGFVICLVRGSLQMVILIVVCHQFHSVLSL